MGRDSSRRISASAVVVVGCSYTGYISECDASKPEPNQTTKKHRLLAVQKGMWMVGRLTLGILVFHQPKNHIRTPGSIKVKHSNQSQHSYKLQNLRVPMPLLARRGPAQGQFSSREFSNLPYVHGYGSGMDGYRLENGHEQEGGGWS